MTTIKVTVEIRMRDEKTPIIVPDKEEILEAFRFGDLEARIPEKYTVHSRKIEITYPL